MNLKEIILEKMFNAEDNGYPVWGWEADSIADEMFAYSDVLQGENYDEVVLIITEILENRE